MPPFTNFRFNISVVLVISIISFNITQSISIAIHGNDTNAARGKRQTTNTFGSQTPELQQPARGFGPTIPPLAFSQGVCSYKSTSTPCLPDAHYRTFDGSCNNVMNPWWGAVNIPYRRFTHADYADGEFLPRNASVTGQSLPPPRDVSNICSDETEYRAERIVNALFTTFGQFLDHDLTNAATALDDEKKQVTCQCQDQAKNPFCLNIATPDMPDQACMVFPRSSAIFQREEACQLRVREQINQINSFVDASMVYGNSKARSDDLRTFSKGQLKTTANTLPPQTTTGKEGGSCRDAQAGRSCFLCGDTRSNENIGLTSFHTIFLRLHNEIALALSQQNTFWTDDVIFHETRRIIIGILEHLVYDEFLPLLIGPSRSNFGAYQYDPSTDPTISSEFAIAGYRFGHTLVNGFVRRFNSQHEMIEEIPLSQVIFRPAEAYNQPMGGLDTLIMGYLETPASKFDLMLNDVLRNHLFEAAPLGRQVQTKRFDLAAVNVNRGRDHGLPSYNVMRQFCGLPRATSFNDLADTIDSSAIQRIASVYAHVDDIDLYIGGIAERSVSDGVVGPTFACLISRQFNNLRRGDRFFYETQDPVTGFTPNQLNEIHRVTLASILCETVQGMTEVQKDAFKTPNNSDNPHVSCSSFPVIDLSLWRQ